MTILNDIHGFAMFACMTEQTETEILAAYKLNQEGEDAHWVVALYDDDNLSYVTFWLKDDWVGWCSHEAGDHRASAISIAYHYALGYQDGRKKSCAATSTTTPASAPVASTSMFPLGVIRRWSAKSLV